MTFAPGSLATSEYEFFAENSIITILPRKQLPRLNLIQGDFGPFQPLIPAEVPLWLALTLKARQRCTIRPPSWLSVDELRERLDAEKRNNERFEEFPPDFLEIAHLLLETARDDIPDAHKVEGLIEDIEAKRHAKVRYGLGNLDGPMSFIRMDNLTPLEINRVRKFAGGALDTLARLEPDERGAADSTQPAGSVPPAGGGPGGGLQPGTSSNALQLVLQRRSRPGAA